MASERCDATVYFDGSCPLCRTEIAYYRGRDRDCRLQFIDVSDPKSSTPSGVTQREAMRRFHVEMADGSVLSGAAAFRAVWTTLPGWRWLARLAALPGVTPMLELAYRAFLPVRPIFARALRPVLRESTQVESEDRR